MPIQIKALDVLIKEFQSSKELYEDQKCSELNAQLLNQQKSCQEWLDKFYACFNSNGDLDPPGGSKAIF